MEKGLVRRVYNLDAALVERIKDFQFANRLESETDAARRLLEAGLVAEAQKEGA